VVILLSKRVPLEKACVYASESVVPQRRARFQKPNMYQPEAESLRLKLKVGFRDP